MVTKSDLRYLFFLMSILTVAFFFSFFKFGNLLYDCGREFLVPSAILDGKIPVKEIFLSYFPLSYEINALLFKIFGSGFDTLRFAGVSSAIMSAGFMYFSARFFVKEKEAFLISLSASLITMFNVSYLFNYVMGYSYAFIYAVCFFFLSLYCMLCYIKYDRLLYLWFFVSGVCFALKAEFVFLIIPSIFLLIYKKVSFKKIITSLLIYLTPVILSFLPLFLKGFSFSDLIGYFVFIKKFLSSKILSVYNSYVFVTNPIKWLQYNFMSFLNFLIPFSVSFLILYFPVKCGKKIPYTISVFILFIVLFVYSVIRGSFCAVDIFSFLCITSLFILYYSVKNKNILLLFFTLYSLFLAVRINFIFTGNYSAYLMPPFLILNLIFFGSILNKPLFNKIILTFVFTIGLVNISYFLTSLLLVKYPVDTDKGLIIIDNKKTAQTILDVVSYLKEIDEDKKVLILPDGSMFNWLAGKKTDLRYYQLLPNHIEVLGEENIVNNLKLNPPEYILTTNLDYAIYGTPLFCRDFGKKICEFTKENYSFVKTISNGEELIVDVYKLNPEN